MGPGMSLNMEGDVSPQSRAYAQAKDTGGGEEGRHVPMEWRRASIGMQSNERVANPSPGRTGTIPKVGDGGERAGGRAGPVGS